jgi:hypothetical protein
LAAEPGEGAFGFLSKLHLRTEVFGGRSGFAGWGFDGDFDEVGAGAAGGGGLGVLAAGSDEFGLGERVGGEDFEDGGEVLVGEVAGLGAEDAADVAAGEAGGPGDVGLVEVATLGLALEDDGEIAHFFWLMCFIICNIAGFATIGNLGGMARDERDGRDLRRSGAR